MSTELLWRASQLISERASMQFIRDYHAAYGNFDELPVDEEQARIVKVMLLAYFGWTGAEYSNRNPSRDAFYAANRACIKLFSGEYKARLANGEKAIVEVKPADPLDERKPEWLGYSLRELKQTPPVVVYGYAQWDRPEFNPPMEEILIATAKYKRARDSREE